MMDQRGGKTDGYRGSSTQFFYFYFLFLAMLGLCYCVRAFSSCNTWTSLPVAHGLSCSAARRISDPQPQMKPTSPVLEGGFSTVGPPGLTLSFSRVFTLEGVECRLQVEY